MKWPLAQEACYWSKAAADELGLRSMSLTGKLSLLERDSWKTCSPGHSGQGRESFPEEVGYRAILSRIPFLCKRQIT